METSVNWTGVSDEMMKIAKAAASIVGEIRTKLRDIPENCDGAQVFVNPKTKKVWVSVGDWAEKEDYEKYRAFGKDTRIEAEVGPPRDERDQWIMVKRAYSPTLHAIGQATNFIPGPTNTWFGGPNPLAATLAGGVLGAGAGYGIGTGAEMLGQENFDPGRLRSVMALLGAAAGAAPGLWWGSLAQREKHSPAAWLTGSRYDPPISEAHKGLQEIGKAPSEHFKKALDDSFDSGFDSFHQIPDTFNSNQFNRTVWSDPMTPAPIRAATSGLVNAAGMFRGSPIITPWDVAKIAVGAGSGYASAVMVGKTLGALAGLKPEAQKTLQQAGTWAGVLTSVVPKALGY